ncbi:ABC transporter permease [Pseudooceanicola nanhaiensis]|jgi:ABC-type polysaccharide/polyol phosphate export permease|uniref:ABC transporter permease n=1 Tax=Pseudooceanicola nanhaiensis TaxID=375761 RepID=A0A917T3G4_9RHOB|nr:ABC transporter permease [Pseudooceanicola nanhaiensis]GGM06897.1 ABC transporter permease [Pseudooceanicola nanhaiensis]
MFEQNTPRTTFQSGVQHLELIYHSIVRDIRKSHGNAFLSILLNMLQAAMFVISFYVMFTILGLRSSAVRGDFLLYIMSGIFLFMTHTKTLGAVVASEGPASPMMKHAPMNTLVAIASAALGTLYIQVLSMVVILFIYHTLFTQITIEQPIAAFGCLLIAWFTGAALGVLLLSIKPWFPRFVGIFTTVYQRANMIASGKMFLANSLPGYMLAMFDWNPLFHCIDQARGFIFINYFPRYTNLAYPMYVGMTLLMVGMMAEFYTRKHASVSWGARR